MTKPHLIRAAGVVILRDADTTGGKEFLAVHRPGPDDWSLPKGKVDSGEHVISAAVRECDEETGFTPQLNVPLTTSTYSVGGRPKVVHYWRASVRAEEGFAPDDEVDEIAWVDVAQAPDTLTYPSDRERVQEAVSLPDTVPLIILRHTKALKRSDFTGDLDIDRPLTGQGRTQAKALVPLLDAYGPLEVHTSSARRCADTVKKYVKHAGTELFAEDALTEEHHREKPKGAARLAQELATLPEPVLICSHRPVLPTIVTAVAGALGIEEMSEDGDWDPKLPPGGFIVVHRKLTPKGNMRVVAVERHTLDH